MLLLPNIETFKGWGLEARIDKKLNKTEEMLDKISSIATSYSVLAYNITSDNAFRGVSDFDSAISASKNIESISNLITSDKETIKAARKKYEETLSKEVYSVWLSFRMERLPNDKLEENIRTDINVREREIFFAMSPELFRNITIIDPGFKYLNKTDADKLSIFAYEASRGLEDVIATGLSNKLMTVIFNRSINVRNKLYRDIFLEEAKLSSYPIYIRE
ncbi:hypothetical protein mvi_11670 [Methylobacterium indicum]|uniref:Uncharacterized protein n=2 Tax=Methylobacterium indicum TaxID=1775910 RepID=A0A8H8WQX3_9HYPH|nr:hypothetical protein mvi_11670 [Methylobacterium indicum]